MMGSVRGAVKFATRWLTVLVLIEKGRKMTLTMHREAGGNERKKTLITASTNVMYINGMMLEYYLMMIRSVLSYVMAFCKLGMTNVNLQNYSCMNIII